jgi:hypothetical protein
VITLLFQRVYEDNSESIWPNAGSLSETPSRSEVQQLRNPQRNSIRARKRVQMELLAQSIRELEYRICSDASVEKEWGAAKSVCAVTAEGNH